MHDKYSSTALGTTSAYRTVRLAAVMSPAEVLTLLQQLPECLPVLIELHSAFIDADDDLDKFLREWNAIIVVMCRGDIRGDASILLLDKALNHKVLPQDYYLIQDG